MSIFKQKIMNKLGQQIFLSEEEVSQLQVGDSVFCFGEWKQSEGSFTAKILEFKILNEDILTKVQKISSQGMTTRESFFLTLKEAQAYAKFKKCTYKIEVWNNVEDY